VQKVAKNDKICPEISKKLVKTPFFSKCARWIIQLTPEMDFTAKISLDNIDFSFRAAKKLN
jgi:hypothetical protein